ncbi:excisionase [Sinorhizobium medicae]|uniref:excisionase n=1 Tax=Sinorhizobium medicae TaxID=110321 RepID=UPI0012971E5E|nr:excisionase [Sinorhizobium medicae]MQX94750.1 excisionase [Sinorhizobium medicae]
MPQPDEDKLDPSAPMRLKDIIPIAFPHGGITPAGLRREDKRVRLKLMRIAGKDFTTLAAIEEMQRLCVVEPDRGEAPLHPDDRGKAALAAARAIAHELRTGRRGQS